MLFINNQDSASLKKYHVIYLIAFGVIALIAISSQLLIQNYLGDQVEDSFLINVAGKQRMLSQRITKNVLQYIDNTDEDTKSLIQEDLDHWVRAHELLKNGELIDADYNTKEILVHYIELDEYFYVVYNSVNEYIDTKDSKAFAAILENEPKYLSRMDALVDMYDVHFQAKIRNLKRIELGLAFFLIAMLIIEMVFVFLPLIKKLQKVFDFLLKAEKESSELVKNLNKANVRISQRNKEISDINLALDRAVMVVRINPKGEIIYANDSYCKLTKYTFDELNKKALFYNNDGSGESIIYKHIRNPHECKKLWKGEVRDTASNGEVFWLDVTLFPIINEQNILYEYFVICNDITKRKEAEFELKVLNEAKLREQEEDQKLNSRAIIYGQEAERKRMAAEVHDGLGQMLTALKFTNSALIPADDSQKEIQARMEQLLKDIIKETRRISSDLLPTVLTDFGFIAGIKELITVCSKNSNINFELKNKILMFERPAIEKEIAIYRVVQEAFNNAMKYSEADDVLVVINEDSEFLTVRILDDGKGISNLEELLHNTSTNKGHGLRNMKERTKLVTGNFYINSKVGKGTEIFIEIPV